MKLEINGNQYGLQWGTGAFEIACEKLNMSVNEVLLGVADNKVILTLAYSAIQNWYELQDETNVLPFSYRQFQAWLDEQDQQVAADIVKDFYKSKYEGKVMEDRYNELIELLNQNNPEAAKKKVVKKQSRSAK